MLVDFSSLAPGADASPLLQAALDSGNAVQLPEQRLTLARPVYASSGCDIRGTSTKSELYANNKDALVVMPAAQRNYDPATHIVANAIDANKWAFRSRGLAGLRFHNTRADAGWAGADNWRAVRQFAVEMVVSRHNAAGTIAGLAWRVGSAEYRASPWLVYQHPDRLDQCDFKLTLANDTECNFRCRVGAPSDTPVKLVFKVNLDAGTFVCEKDGVVVADVQSIGAALVAGAALYENRGAPLWLGGGSQQAGGACPPELGKSDTTFHAFRVWRSASPPASGYSPHGWYPNTVIVLPYAEADKPHVGDQAVGFTGEQTAFGYLVPFTGAPTWAAGVRVEGVTFVGEDYGTGLSINSAVDVVVNHCRFIKGCVGLQIMGGPLPCYPVRVRDLYGDHQTDCLARVNRCIVREFENVTAKYPRRSVARFDECGAVFIRDVFHAPEGAGANNTVTDCLRLDNCIRMRVESWLSNYEDGWGPRFSYLRACGLSLEPSQTQILYVRDFEKQSLRAGASFINDVGLAASCVRQITDSFDIAPMAVAH